MKMRISDSVENVYVGHQAHFLRKYMRLAKNQVSRAVEFELDFFSSYGDRLLLDEWYEAREVVHIIMVDAASFLSEQSMRLLGNSVNAHELRLRKFLKELRLP